MQLKERLSKDELDALLKDDDVNFLNQLQDPDSIEDDYYYYGCSDEEYPYVEVYLN